MDRKQISDCQGLGGGVLNRRESWKVMELIQQSTEVINYILKGQNILFLNYTSVNLTLKTN